MAIRHWSGRRLVGTWVAGAVGEVMLIALPVAFFVVVMSVGNGHAVSAARVTELNARVAEVDQRMAALKAIEANESRADIKNRELGAPLAPVRVPRVDASSAPNELNAMSIDAAPYAIPMAASIILYVFAIPVGLVAITLIWLITRVDRQSPPPASA